MSEDSPRHPLLTKTSGTLLVMLAVLALPYASPRLRMLRITPAPWDHEAPEPVAEGPTQAAPALTVGDQELKASGNTATVTNALPAEANVELPDIDPAIRAKLSTVFPVEDPTGHALDDFYAQLSRTAKKEPGAVTRILHYGDSVIASDYVSGTMRRRFQQRFGDAGHGFILIANPWQWYFHNDVVHWASDGWSASRLSGPLAPDGMYGLGGVSFQAYGGATATFGTAEKGDFGRRASRFDLYYLEQPNGGDVQLTLKGGAPVVVPTRGPAKASKVYSLPVEDGPAHLTLRSLGNVRLFGMSLERDVPGVTYDALGAHAAMVTYWKNADATHWKDQMELRKPSLVILQYGTNESDLWRLDLEEYEKTLGDVIEKVKNAAPHASLLVAAPLDRAEKGPGGKLRTKPIIPRIVEVQRRVALAKGCAFWNTYDAMGGEGSMAKWVSASPSLAGGDLTHPTPLGAELLGAMFTGALLAGFETFQVRGR
jgi:lysophospholipase L1-like esterase